MKSENMMFCGVLFVGFLYLFLVTFTTLPASGMEHAKTIVGFVLGSVVSILIGYKWGSSSGSESKSKTIADNLKSETKKND